MIVTLAIAVHKMLHLLLHQLLCLLPHLQNPLAVLGALVRLDMPILPGVSVMIALRVLVIPCTILALELLIVRPVMLLRRVPVAVVAVVAAVVIIPARLVVRFVVNMVQQMALPAVIVSKEAVLVLRL